MHPERQSAPDLSGITGSPDTSGPNAARMYDYYLGGSANFAVDRATADEQIAVLPSVASTARANRAFLGRAVRMCLDAGVNQFLDLGSGVPTVGNVHEIAHQIDPEARIAYVDREPIAVAHSRRLLRGDERVSVTQADLTEPEKVLSAPGVANLLDFSKPVAVLAISVLHFVRDDQDPAGILATYRDACVPGSFLAISHTTAESLARSTVDEGLAIYQRTSTPVFPRPIAEAPGLLGGYEVLEPGATLVTNWRPDSEPDPASPVANTWAVVGILR
ncbi:MULTISPECIES: SAM-dependent methyltransferase [Saccharopolyspora]|uniref:SAM-dependent methyltransferase n=1 Tax=Saccharopolyspora gregorii TaxID=33914 RepID=A0ABP6S105_9PSEU|nr:MULTISPECIES: SAM-dependent methyltransferase [Saccharopolyspora]MCA1187743.1 SAM-dependent methyltransferase [Saccharopolyspora sp. 6T]MCA1225945.1 SAM-dependent methyltransferase [Saccharopolyspora sp. 6M]